MAIDLITGKKVKNTEDIKEPKPKKGSPLFDSLKLMFKNPVKFKDLSNYEKTKNGFMMNRFFSIKYPIQAQMMNRMYINGGESVQYWGSMLSKLYTDVPTWIWTTLKQIKTKKSEIKNKLPVKEETLNFYCQKMQISRKDLDYAIDVLGDKFIKELKQIEKTL